MVRGWVDGGRDKLRAYGVDEAELEREIDRYGPGGARARVRSVRPHRSDVVGCSSRPRAEPRLALNPEPGQRQGGSDGERHRADVCRKQRWRDDRHDLGREPGDGRADHHGSRARGRRPANARRTRACSPAGMERARLRRARPGPAARAEVDARQRRPDHRRGRVRERQDPRGRAAGRPRLHGRGARLLGQGGRRVPRGRARALVEQPRRGGQEARHPLRPDRAGGRDRAVELPDRQLVRRLHPGARGRQQRAAQAERGDAAELAADGGDAARMRRARRRLSGRHGRRRHRRCADRAGRLRDVHGLEQDRQDGAQGGRRADDPLLPGARRQGPDDRLRRCRHRARRQRGRVLRAQQRRPGLHLGRARVRRGARLRPLRRGGHRQRAPAAAGSARPVSEPSTSARSRSRRRSRSSTPTSRTRCRRARRS